MVYKSTQKEYFHSKAYDLVTVVYLLYNCYYTTFCFYF